MSTSGPVTSPRFTFLGTGTSGGIPLIACDCAVCTSSDPRDTRSRTSACVRWIDGTGVERVALIDCSPDLHAQARREGLWRCDAILFTHNHVDHIFGLDEVRRFNAVMKAPIDIYAEPYVLDALRRVYKHVFDAAANVNDSFVATLIPHEIIPIEIGSGRPFSSPSAVSGRGVRRDLADAHGGRATRERFDPIDLFGLRFEPLRLLHGRLPIVGWRIEESAASAPSGLSPFPLAYCTDVSAIPPDTWPRFSGLKTLVLDALRHRHHPTHLTLDQALAIAERVGAERTYFVHMAHELGHAQTEAGLPPNIRLAYDGLTLGEPAPPGSAWRPAPSLRHAAARFEEG